ncbi:MAG: hypothetical protein QS721_09945 [Candidatus Endonucleobacter sp. (ex Gigantidas childressi)]|nr:hypothetical protein [Candidatus Endonucleobacter sp. (ex Gigantidas childressi)]
MNVLDFVETDKKGKRHTWYWITDLKLDEMTVESIMKGGRCRCHIENKTFNTLKNQGYNLEHNYGHGEKHLTTNLAYLTVLSFLVDQMLPPISEGSERSLERNSHRSMEADTKLFSKLAHKNMGRAILYDY